MKFEFIDDKEPEEIRKIKEESGVYYYSPIDYYGRLPNPYGELYPSDFLTFAKEELKTTENSRALINAVSHVKKCVHLNIDLLLNQFCLFNSYKRKNIPKKREIIEKLKAVPSTILEKINLERNLVEPEYKIPSCGIVKESIDIAELFLMATERFFLRMVGGMRIGIKNNDKDILI